MTRTNWSLTDAWRAAQAPEALAQALTMGEQIAELIDQAATLVQRARWNVDTLIEGSYIRCQVILDRLTDEANRLAPMLTRLHAAHKAVPS